MKNQIKIGATLLIAFILFLIITGISYAANDNDNEKNANGFSKNSIGSLIAGIKSDNTGLRKSSVYLSGVYEITEMVDPLIDRLAEEKNPEIKNLILISLYSIGNEKALAAVKNIIENEDTTGK